MFYKNGEQDTICAQSTPTGVGGISVIRVSGPKAVSSVRQRASFLPENPESHKVYYGILKSKKNEDIDEVLISFFKQGRSFTGEDVLEISCHGSPVIVNQILNELVGTGTRLAEKGEFTFRAFMNNRIDLVQAESVLSLIESQSQLAAKQSLRQLQGSLSHQIKKIESDIIWCLAHMEADIDFSTEGLQTLPLKELDQRLSVVQGIIAQLTESYKTGRAIQEGYRLVLAGIPNVGKSSLLNSLVEDEKAIVTEIPGTTRDLVDGFFFVNGLKVNAIDTAGLRESEDIVELKGIERSRKAISEADAVFFVYDVNLGISKEEADILNLIPVDQLTIIGNKTDKKRSSIESLKKSLIEDLKKADFLQKIPSSESFLAERVLFLSALDKNSRTQVISYLEKELSLGKIEDESYVSNLRHQEQLSLALNNIKSSRRLVVEGLSPEFVAIELKEALLAIQKVLGKRFDDEVMDRVFKEFCIGK